MNNEKIVHEGDHKFIVSLDKNNEITKIICEDDVGINYFLKDIKGNLDPIELNKELYKAIKIYDKYHR